MICKLKEVDTLIDLKEKYREQIEFLGFDVDEVADIKINGDYAELYVTKDMIIRVLKID